ncbi:hypothetical protein MJO55_07170 [Mycolicibacterium rufum]|uniref:PASTA domain-containing protein n=1 Tax=Mycolicibacterium rufum TaxID=318424 RepID=A0A9X2YHB3_9MYCO|nr:hypothetical protein [Mycolicibacterium rufum]KGI67292.1 hypothetical protein EU78_07325 [Mycolicibacterium rufum]MCV7073489.1 hypothetical protein [Mycolicibacterium rufum]ULP38203.1 hypothetical protein MJO55_07170 [Mycolicibacterium rufum]
MRKQMAAAAMASTAVVASVGLAGPAAAQDEWIMPDVRGEILETAINDVRAVTGDVELDIRLQPNVNQVVYNYSNWAVCATSPRPDREISQKTKRVIFALRRLNEKC